MIIEKKKLKDLKPSPYNPRQISPEQLKALENSMNNILTCGNCNKEIDIKIIESLKKIGLKPLVCSECDSLEELYDDEPDLP